MEELIKKKQILAFTLSAAIFLTASGIVLHTAAMEPISYDEAAESRPISDAAETWETAAQAYDAADMRPELSDSPQTMVQVSA